jgi:hypothetical protein
VPLQNRVNPLGEIVAVSYRGTMLGNRGRLHDASRTIVRHSQLARWLCCQLNFRGRQRTVMSPRSYTELFFLDEATALAAGHRPCAECRYRAYQRFRAAWRDAGLAERLPAAPEIDARLARDRGVRFDAPVHDLPDGVLVQVERQPHLLWRRQLVRWEWTGYRAPECLDPNSRVQVLTPRVTVQAIHAGYPVSVHPSAPAAAERG